MKSKKVAVFTTFVLFGIAFTISSCKAYNPDKDKDKDKNKQRVGDILSQTLHQFQP